MGQPATLRLKNRPLVLSAHFEYVRLTRPQIVRLVRASAVTVNSVIRDLLGQGMSGPLHGPLGLDVQWRQLHVVKCIHLADGDDLTGRELWVAEQHRKVRHRGLPKSVTLFLFTPVGPGRVPGELGALPDSDLPRVAAWGQVSRVLTAFRMSGARMAAAHARNALLVQGCGLPEAM